MDQKVQRERAERFRALHNAPPILVLPNAWDAASAKVFEQAGFAAVGTTSGGIAAVLGYPDGERISRREMLQMVSYIVSSVSLPVNADMEAGYGGTLEGVAKTIRDVIVAGAVGINLEDGTRSSGSRLADIAFQCDKIRTVREVADSMGIPLVLNARTDVYLRSVGEENTRFGEVVRRAKAYREAGADSIFVIGVKDRDTIAGLVREIPGPVNLLATSGSPTIAELEQLGVARVTFGSGAMRATVGFVRRIARELQESGTYSFLDEGTPSLADIDRMFAEAYR